MVQSQNDHHIIEQLLVDSDIIDFYPVNRTFFEWMK